MSCFIEDDLLVKPSSKEIGFDRIQKISSE